MDRALEIVEFGEFAACAERNEIVKLFIDLPFKVGMVHRKSHALSPGIFDQPVSLRAGSECLPRAGGHLDERMGVILHKGLFQLGDSIHLASAHPAVCQHVCEWYLCQPHAQGIRFGRPSGGNLGLVECKDVSRTWVQVAFVAEKDLYARRFNRNSSAPVVCPRRRPDKFSALCAKRASICWRASVSCDMEDQYFTPPLVGW